MTTSSIPPRVISHYRLLEPLGRGAMGEVWLAEDTQLPRQVAVKLLPAHLAEEAEAVQRMLREAQAAASVDHPAVVTVYEAGLAAGQPYIVMQRLEGETLAQRLERGVMPVADAVSLATQVADALAEVHALGIVHRDLKPSNIMLTARGAKILDFGVATVRSLPGLTTPGATVGTPRTMSPEQVRGAPPDNRADLWALGVILYRALTGVWPFDAADQQGVLQRVLQHEPARPSTLRPEIDPDLEHLVLKLLRKEAAHRYSRAEELLADLACCGKGLSSSAAAREPQALAEPEARRAPGLAVLRFEVLSADPDDAYLAAGLAEDLIVDLSRVEGLHVPSRADVAPYSERNVPPRTLARELGVDFVLLGSVRRHGNRARISAQLVRASDGHVLWGGRFDRTLEDLFEVQAEVSAEITQALQLALAPEEREMLRRAPTRNTEAYTLYLKARELADRSKEENLRAAELLRQALDLDPGFALAHAALGECLALRSLRWWAGMEMAEPALACARRALELEPGLPDAHRVESMVLRLQGKVQEMLQVLEKVLATNEDGETLEWVGWCYLTLGQPERAVPVLERLVARRPDLYMGAVYLSNGYDMQGKTAESERLVRLLRERLLDLVRRAPDSVHPRAILAGILVRLGEIEAGLAQIDRAIALAPDDGRIRYNAACALALAGREEVALDHLEAAVRHMPTYISDWPRRDPDLASLHSHPRFVRLFPAT